MRFAYFTHSLASCWNHGNAHFLRGVLRELAAAGHSVAAFEPRDAWSRQNLRRDAPPGTADAWQAAYPELRAIEYPPGAAPAPLVDGADVVIVHEWNDPALVAALGALRRAGARFTLLFHDTHHRAVSEPGAMQAYDLRGYDGILAFGRTLAEVYRRWGWGDRVFTWHEAADIRHFHPPAEEQPRAGAVWIGNWGDGERTAELEAFLLQPTAALGLPLDIHGVRYPETARAMLDRHGARYHGWLPNHRAPEVFARHLLTIHVPRRFYTTLLPGIPTIRVFEALACGIPSSPPPGTTPSTCSPPAATTSSPRTARHAAPPRHLLADPARRADLAAHGLATIRARHTCAHRAAELMSIVQGLRA